MLCKNVFEFLGWNSDSQCTYPGRQEYAASENLSNCEIALFRTGVWFGHLPTYWVYVTLGAEESSSVTFGSEGSEVPSIFLIEIMWVSLWFV